MKLKFVAGLFLALGLSFAPAFGSALPGPRAPRGFTKKASDATFALYASSVEAGVSNRFLCTVTAIAKVKGGYELLGAGHCTPANVGDLPPDMTFTVAEQMGGTLMPVALVKSVMIEPLDYSVFYLPTTRKYPTIKLGDERKARVGDKTLDINFSLGITKEVSPGIVVSTLITDASMINGTAGFFEIQQFDSHGASGSSVIDLRGHRIIGIVIAGIDGATIPSFVEPISTIEAQIKNLKMPDVTEAQLAAQEAKAAAAAPTATDDPSPRAGSQDPCDSVMSKVFLFLGKTPSDFEAIYGDYTSVAIESSTESHYAYARRFHGDQYFIEFEFIVVDGKVVRVQNDACGEGGHISAPSLPPSLE